MPAAQVKKAEPAPQSMLVDSESCFVCGDVMLPSMPVEAFLNKQVEQPGSRRLQCDSGHSFCVDCWSGSVSVQVNDNGLGCLPCPGFKCGELLDVRWAPVLLKTPESVTRMMTRRRELVVDCCQQLKACPIDNCGVIVCVPAHALNTLPATAPAPGTPVKPQIPSCLQCRNGHIFCLECSQPAHSPCTCAQLASWNTLVQEEIKTADVKGKGGDPNNVEGAELANGE
jgi:hypothetical protein